MPAAAITGIGESAYFRAGRSPYSSRQLASIAVRTALDDAGLRHADIDGIVTYNNKQHDAASLWSQLGLGNLRFSASPWGGGGNGAASAIQLAEMAVSTGHAQHVLVFRSIHQGAEGRYGQHRAVDRATEKDAFSVPFGNIAPVIKNALLTRKFMHMYGVTQDALAEIALASYAHAQRNPRAIMYGRPLTRERYHNSRWIAEPLHLHDCCQESDGACALIVSGADRAADLRQPVVHILASATGMHPGGGTWGFNDADYPSGRLKPVGNELWARAGVRPHDVDVAQFYENFTGTTLIAIADMGFCAPDELEAFVGDNQLLVGGALPLNTSGGNLAEAYIHGLELALEAVRQVRGQSTAQVDDVELSLFVAGPGTPPASAMLLAPHR